MKPANLIVAGLTAGLAVSTFLSPAGACNTKYKGDAAAITETPGPWMDASLPPDERAALALKEMTLEEKLSLVHGIMPIKLPFLPSQPPIPADAIGSAGYVPGVARLGIPPLQETDGSLGIAYPMNAHPNDQATALPSNLATAASFNPDIAYANGAMIGNEAWSKGLNVLLDGGVNLARDPRNGRNFEYLGEDPLLAGTLGGAAIRGIQDQHVISTIKHYVINDQETNRNYVNAVIGEAALRESDMLAFEIAIEKGHPGSVMCSYNLVNGAYGCGNNYTLNQVLKGDWAYPGWVMADWGALHALDYAVKGLDQESAVEFDAEPFFNQPLKQAIENGTIPESRLDDMVRRILRSMFAAGVIDHPATKTQIDLEDHAKVAQNAEEEGIVLLKNSQNLLPLSGTVKRIAVIGNFANFGVLSGGGSSQVIPPNSRSIPNRAESWPPMMVWHPSSPLEAIQRIVPDAEIKFDDGHNLSAAAKLAKWADVVVVFTTKWQTEGTDSPGLTLPDGQDVLISTLAADNPKTVVVLETGNPVLMPWLDKAGAVIEAWYPGERGGPAIANVLFGKINPSGRLPITFPKSIEQYTRPEIPGSGKQMEFFAKAFDPSDVFDVRYTEGANIGYRWFAAENKQPLFAFGYGLSYTSFEYRKLTVKGGDTLTICFDDVNTGKVAGKDVPQVYLTDAAGKPILRLVGFTKLALNPGETKHVTLHADPRLLANYDESAHGWRIGGGTYTVALGHSAIDPALTGSANVDARILQP